MKRKIVAALAMLAILSTVSATAVAADDGLPRWFRDFIAALEGRLGQFAARFQALEQQTAQNTTAIAQNTTAINQNAAATAQNTAAIAQNAAVTQQNTAAIQQNTTDIAQNAQTMNAAIQQGQAAIAMNTADIARNTLDTARNTTDIAALQGAAQASYRYSDYAGTNVVSRVFSAVGAGLCGNSETQTTTRTPQPDGSTLVVIDQLRRAGPNTCSHVNSQFRADPDGFHLLSSDGITNADPTVTATSTVFDFPILTRAGTMHVGASWGSASKETQTNFLAGGTQSLGFTTLVSTLTAVESVTVPAGTFNDCLRIAEVRNSSHIGNYTQYDWLCRDVGLVKRLNQPTVATLPSAPVGFQLDLQSYTTQ